MLTFFFVVPLSMAQDNQPIIAKDPVPSIEAVPSPSVLPDDAPAKKVKLKAPVDDDPKVDLIKEEKPYIDKNCRMVKGKIKCKKKKLKRKTIN